uniref:cytochrome c oxidase subunit II n=1 Tax=Dolophilodes bellatulus TaxID=2682779 RepID=UPI0022DCDC16|nr:cytochrome c oxidase subunit II [Dolophilodes bellatulus]UZZ43885.1 cytochrome c oxidase subunit II [Dolophilodes bellatulus]
MATWSNLMFQNSSSPLMEQLIFFYDNSMLILTLITVFIMYMMFILFFNKLINLTMIEHQNIELIWTILPGVFLIFIGIPSIHLLYLLDESNLPSITLKIMGHQWYWSYEYSDFKNIEFDSYMNNEFSSENFRLLEVDNRIILPMKFQIRTLISSSDVIHAWTVPSLGVKVDAMPGRLNQASFFLNRPGLFYGQCSEICGANHSFMPISLESINLPTFINWINNN